MRLTPISGGKKSHWLRWLAGGLGCLLPWLPLVAQSPTSEASSTPQPWDRYGIALTPDEVNWIKQHPVVKLGLDPQWPPFSFSGKDGIVKGIDLDYLREIELRLGIKFDLVKSRVWDETNARIFRGGLDVVSGISPTERRKEALLFTSSYISFPTGIITRLDAPFFTDFSTMRGVTLASPRRYVTTERLKVDFKNLPLIETSTLLEALQLVSSGKADATVENLAAVSYLIRENGLTNLKIAGLSSYRFELHIGVRKGLPLLHSSIQKAMDTITEKQRTEILGKWVRVEFEKESYYGRYWKWIAALLIVGLLGLVAFWLWNRHLTRELTERRRIENQLRLLNEEKSHFMNMAAHDLNSPLTVIMLKCELAALQGNIHDSTSRIVFSEIMDNAERISTLIRNLLNANAIEQGLNQLHLQTVELSAVAQHVVERFSSAAQKKKIQLHFQSATPFCQVQADPDALLQVLENLISNALKFSPIGSEIKVKIMTLAHAGRIEIIDSGPGISPQDRPRLFGKYARLTARPTGNESSHGLGLSIVKKLVEQMHGRVDVESLLGSGATFFVELPLASTTSENVS